jgi:hypothetical protein
MCARPSRLWRSKPPKFKKSEKIGPNLETASKDQRPGPARDPDFFTDQNTAKNKNIFKKTPKKGFCIYKSINITTSNNRQRCRALIN